MHGFVQVTATEGPSRPLDPLSPVPRFYPRSQASRVLRKCNHTGRLPIVVLLKTLTLQIFTRIGCDLLEGWTRSSTTEGTRSNSPHGALSTHGFDHPR